MTRWVHGISRSVLRAAFCEYFGVGDEYADVLIVLYGRPGEWTHMRQLQLLLNTHRPPTRQAVYERIRVLREIMEPESLLTGGISEALSKGNAYVNEGYALSEVGFAECAKALKALVESLVRAGPQIAISVPPGDFTSPISEMGTEDLRVSIEGLQATRPKPMRVIDEDPAASPVRLISLNQFAERAMFSPGYLRRLSKMGKAPQPVRAGLRTAYLEHEVEEWLTNLPRADLPAPEAAEAST
jgi:predicted DNA-binding transcriptional regulator AlpA